MGVIVKSQKHYLRKVINCQKGGLLILAALLSTIIMTGCTNVMSISADLFIGELSMKEIMLPVLIEAVGIIFYVLFLITDFGTGIYAARIVQERKRTKSKVIRVEKLYRTFWKLLGILLLTCLIGALGVFAVMISQYWAYKTLMWVQIVLLVAACLFEFQSIGDNLEKSTGSKPAIFDFVGILFKVFRKRVVEKASGKKLEFEDEMEDSQNQ